ncbi:MAG TPA: hypothetical protein VJ810_37070 [Blastocatellia bacterium]|nr:hypothetical protein [Blastocatellia bacterium]
MKRITIKSIAILFVFGLAACNSLRTDSVQEGKDSTGGLNATQADNHPATGAQDVNRRVTGARVAKKRPKVGKSPSVRGAAQHVRYVRQRGEGANPSTAITKRRVKKQVEYVELQIIEAQDIAPAPPEVMQPTEVIETQTVQVIEQPVAPTVIVDTNETIIRPQARSLYVASPVSPECSTAYETWVEFSDP